MFTVLQLDGIFLSIDLFMESPTKPDSVPYTTSRSVTRRKFIAFGEGKLLVSHFFPTS